jgi:hypothetical protein
VFGLARGENAEGGAKECNNEEEPLHVVPMVTRKLCWMQRQNGCDTLTP